MSVELDIKLRAPLQWKVFFASLSSEWKRRIRGDLMLSWNEESGNAVAAARSAQAIRIEVGKSGTVQCLSYMAGSIDAIGEDGGWWACVSLASKSPESYLLLLITAALLAQAAETNVVDDSGLLGMGRLITPESVFSVIDSVKADSFSEAARRICKKFNFSTLTATHGA